MSLRRENWFKRLFGGRRRYDFRFRKVDAETEVGTGGAVFHLTKSDRSVIEAWSDTDGHVCFHDLRPGWYQLEEVTPPPGYEQNFNVYELCIAANGRIYIGGVPIRDFVICNSLKPQSRYDLVFMKVKNVEDGPPLPNVVFELHDYNSSVPLLAASNSDGLVIFPELLVGSYYAVERPQEGYELELSPLDIEVHEGGLITINGIPQHEFRAVNIPIVTTIDVQGQIVWVDQDDQAGMRPSTVDIELLQNDAVVERQEVPIGEDCRFRFAELPRYDMQGALYHYALQMVDLIVGYDTRIDGFVVTNIYTLLRVTMIYYDVPDRTVLDTVQQQVAIHSDRTFYAPAIPGFTPAAPSRYTQHNIRNNLILVFQYQRSS